MTSRPGRAFGSLALVLLAGCAPATSPSDSDATSRTAASPSPTVAAGVAKGPGALRQARWVLRTLNAGPPLTDREVQERFSSQFDTPEMRGQVRQTFDGLWRIGREWRAVEVTRDDADQLVDVVLSTPDGGRSFTAQLGTESSGRLSMLQFGPAVNRGVDVTDADAVARELRRSPTDNAVAAADRHGPCRRESSSVADRPLPIASLSKLVVVAAVLRAVAAGELDWGEEIPLDEEVRSLPSPVLDDLPSGTPLSVQSLVEAAVTMSDNTAADLLLARLGESAVLTTWSEIVGEPWRGRFWSTRDLLLEGWAEEADPVTPRWEDGFDWSATAVELCRLGSWLQARRTQFPAASRRAFAHAARQEGYADAWLFKRGGSPGVLAGLWLGREQSGRVVVAQYASRDVRHLADAQGLLWLVGGSLADETEEKE